MTIKVAVRMLGDHPPNSAMNEVGDVLTRVAHLSNVVDHASFSISEDHTPPTKRVIVVTYPPTYDGELHINCVEEADRCSYEFTHSNTRSATGRENADSWDTLVAAAQAIIAQDARNRHAKLHRGGR